MAAAESNLSLCTPGNCTSRDTQAFCMAITMIKYSVLCRCLSFSCGHSRELACDTSHVLYRTQRSVLAELKHENKV
jgi:hypothetical protein